jgi:GxxExxY protein
MESEKEELNRITEAIIGAAIEVHREFGPGLLESTYEACLRFELIERGFEVECQKVMPIVYKRVTIDKGYKLDLLVNGKVVVEVKVVDQLISVHEAQLMSYLKLSGCKVGLLINFNVTLLKQGIRRKVNNYRE